MIILVRLFLVIVVLVAGLWLLSTAFRVAAGARNRARPRVPDGTVVDGTAREVPAAGTASGTLPHTPPGTAPGAVPRDVGGRDR